MEELRPEAFDGVDLVIASTPDDVAAQYLPAAVERGCVVVDESAYYRMDPKVPLVVPEVNPEAALTHQGLIASPNCSTTQMVGGHEAAARRRADSPRGGQHLSGDQAGPAWPATATWSGAPAPI